MKNVEGFPSEQPEESDDLGVEKIRDPEKAQVMASMENLAFEQSKAYENFLSRPETATVKETVEFNTWKLFGYSPADIIGIGQERAEIAGKKYDIEQDIQEKEAKGSQLSLIGMGIKSVFKVGYNAVKFAARWMPSMLFGSKEPKDGNKTKEVFSYFRQFDLESYRFLAAREALHKMNDGKGKKRTEYTEEKLNEQVLEALKEAEGYKLPDAEEKEDSMGEDEKKKGKEKKSKGVVADTFGWIRSKYIEYLSMSPEEKEKQSSVFKDMEENGTTIKDLNDQEEAVSEWLDGLTIYHKRLKKMSDEQLEEEKKFSFMAFVGQEVIDGGKKKKKKKSGFDILLGLGVSAFKTFESIREIERRKSKKTDEAKGS